MKKLSNDALLAVCEGVPTAKIKRDELKKGISIVDLLASKTGFLPSNGEAKRELKANAISLNKEKVTEGTLVGLPDLINDTFILLGKGKKNNDLVVVE